MLGSKSAVLFAIACCCVLVYGYEIAKTDFFQKHSLLKSHIPTLHNLSVLATMSAGPQYVWVVRAASGYMSIHADGKLDTEEDDFVCRLPDRLPTEPAAGTVWRDFVRTVQTLGSNAKGGRRRESRGWSRNNDATSAKFPHDDFMRMIVRLVHTAFRVWGIKPDVALVVLRLYIDVVRTYGHLSEFQTAASRVSMKNCDNVAVLAFPPGPEREKQKMGRNVDTTSERMFAVFGTYDLTLLTTPQLNRLVLLVKNQDAVIPSPPLGDLEPAPAPAAPEPTPAAAAGTC